MTLLFRQLVARAGKVPKILNGDVELYSFWVGNILPTSLCDRQELLETRNTERRIQILIRLMTDTIEQTRASELDPG